MADFSGALIPRLAQGEGHAALLDQQRRSVRHAWRAAFARSQHLDVAAQQRPAGAVVGGWMHAHPATDGADVAQLGRQAEQA